MGTPRLAPNTDYVADDNDAPFVTHRDTADERPAAAARTARLADQPEALRALINPAWGTR